MKSNVLKGRSKSERPSVENLAIRIVFLYASLSSLWMLFTDRLLAAQSYELTGLAWPVAVQCWGFVLVTSGLLYLLMRQSVGTQQEKCGVLHSVIESTTDAIFVKDLQGRYFTVNSAGASLLGKPVEEVLGRDDTELFPPETARQIIESDRRVIALSETKTYEECATLKTSGRTFLTTKSACRNPQGNVIGVICRAHEITGRLQTEQALQETDRKLQALIQAAPVAINILDLQGKVQLWNPAAERIFAWSEPEVKGRPLPVVPEDKLDELRGVLETVFQTKQLQEHHSLQIDRMPVGCIVHDSEFRITDWNPAAERIFGFTKAEVQGTVPDRLVPEAVRLDLDSLKQRLKEGDMTAHSLNENLTKDGRTIICEWHNTPLKQADGTVTGVLSMVAEVTDRVRAIEQLRESEERFRTMADSAPMLLWLSGSDGLCTFFNQTWLKFTGRTLEQEIGTGWAEGVHPEDVRCCLQTYRSAFQARESFQMEYRLRRADGEYRWILDAGTPRFTPGGNFVGYIGCAIDITDRKQASEAVRESEARYRHLIESTIEGVWVVDAEGKTVFVNRQMAEMLGYTPEEMQGQPLLAFLDEESLPLATAGSSRRRQGIQERQDLKFRRQDGSQLWAIVSTNPIFDAAGNCAGALSAITDITERKRVEEKLQYYAFYDVLTGLPNRSLFLARAGELIERASLGEGGLFAVLFLDLERFGIVKYTLGHLVADKLLIATARRLEGCLRPTDTAARVGSDEFAILLADIQDVSQVQRIAELIYQQLAKPFDLDGREVFSTTSIGIALSWRDERLAHTQSIASCRDAIYSVSNRVSNRVFEQENPNSQLPALIYDQPEDILRDADTAMHHAKVYSQGHCAVFDPAMHLGALTRLQLESDLQRAIQRRQFQVYYQPIVSLATGRIVGFEALVRWEHPSRGMVSPGEFIPLAEETGLITLIDRWVLREACRQLGVWQRAFPAAKPLMMSVNLSGVQLGQLGTIERLDQVLRETGVDGGSLKLEITESAIMENTAAEIGMLEQLKALGIQLSIDDFGTGYSSLARLHQLPVDTLKIDRSFVSRMTADGHNSEIVHTIVRLAHTLGMDAVAEGVETPQQLEILRTLQCEYGQGYFFSKPVDSDAARALLLSERFPNQNN